jgi:hypothetical protein
MAVKTALAALTGSDLLSVNPAASEMISGRARAVAISQETGGVSVRWPRADNPLNFIQEMPTLEGAGSDRQARSSLLLIIRLSSTLAAIRG